MRAEGIKSETRLEKLNEMRDKLAGKLADNFLYENGNWRVGNMEPQIC